MTRGWIIVVSPTSVPPDRTACPENRDNGSATQQRRASGTIRKKKNTASWGFATPARGLRRPRIALAILPPGIHMMSRLRRQAFCEKGGRLNAARQSQPKRQQQDRESTRLNSRPESENG